MDFMFITHLITLTGVLYLVYRDVKGKLKGMSLSSNWLGNRVFIPAIGVRTPVAIQK